MVLSVGDESPATKNSPICCDVSASTLRLRFVSRHTDDPPDLIACDDGLRLELRVGGRFAASYKYYTQGHRLWREFEKDRTDTRLRVPPGERFTGRISSIRPSDCMN